MVLKSIGKRVLGQDGVEFYVIRAHRHNKANLALLGGNQPTHSLQHNRHDGLADSNFLKPTHRLHDKQRFFEIKTTSMKSSPKIQELYVHSGS